MPRAPNLGIAVIMNTALEKAVELGHPDARVDWKLNARGELVVAIILPPRMPGEWDRLKG